MTRGAQFGGGFGALDRRPRFGRPRRLVDPIDPLTLHDLAVFLDPSDMSTMFQEIDSDTTPAEIDAPVGRIYDKGPRGLLFSATGINRRPTLKAHHDLRYLQFDGVSSALLCIPADFGGLISQPNQVILGARIRDSGYAFDGRSQRNGITGHIDNQLRLFTGIDFSDYVTGRSDTDAQVFTALYNGANSYIRIDRTETPVVLGTEGLNGMVIGGNKTQVANNHLRLYSMVINDGELPLPIRDGVEVFSAERAGVRL